MSGGATGPSKMKMGSMQFITLIIRKSSAKSPSNTTPITRSNVGAVKSVNPFALRHASLTIICVPNASITSTGAQIIVLTTKGPYSPCEVRAHYCGTEKILLDDAEIIALVQFPQKDKSYFFRLKMCYTDYSKPASTILSASR